MNHHAKASSAGSTEGSGNSRGLFRRAFATRVARSGSKGSSAPSTTRRGRNTLAILALAIAAFALTAAPASAAPPTVTVPVVSDVSYTSAHITGEFDGSGFYAIQYSTDGTTWNLVPGGFAFASSPEHVNLSVELKGLKGSTTYHLRMAATNYADPEVFSAEPNPSFTTLAVEQPTIVATDDASAVFSTSAKATGKVKRPANEDPAFDVSACRFEYVSDDDFSATGFDSASKAPCAEISAEAPLTGSDAEKDVSGQLTGLEPATTYHLRLVAGNASRDLGIREATNTFTTLAPVVKASVLLTGDATDVGKRSALVSGEVQRPVGEDPALDVRCRFEYVTDAQFDLTGFEGAGQAGCVETAEQPISATDPTPVTGELQGLEPSTTYHLRLAAVNGGGIDSKEATGTFTTGEVLHPSLTIDSVTDVGYTRFSVTGTADPGNQGVYPAFEFSISGAEEWQGEAVTTLPLVPAGSAPQQISRNLPCYSDLCTAPLKPGTTYQVRLYGYDNEFGGIGDLYVSPEPYAEFTTKGTSTPPSATIDPVTGVSATSAHFSAVVDNHAPVGPLPEEGKVPYETDWHFECTPACPGPGLSGTVSAEEGSKAISIDSIRLDPNTSYEVKLVAENALGTVETPPQSFQTPLVEPTVTPAPGGSDGNGGYILQGVVNPNGSQVTSCEFAWGPTSGEIPSDYAFSAPCSPTSPGAGAKPVTVEAPLSGLTANANYSFRLFATNAAGTAKTANQIFVPKPSVKESCPDEELRKENNSLALPECRIYELVTYPNKEGWQANLQDYSGGGTVMYLSGAPNLLNSGQGRIGLSKYVATRSTTGWTTISGLNGPSGSLLSAPEHVLGIGDNDIYSADLLTSIWEFNQDGGPQFQRPYLRGTDGRFDLIGAGKSTTTESNESVMFGASDDLSHLILASSSAVGQQTAFGPGVYEYLGTGNDQPRRVDVDNSGSPIASCLSRANAISADGRVVIVSPCNGSIWARLGGAVSFEASASHCNRPDCGGAGSAIFKGASSNGLRIYFATSQQLLDADTNQSSDLYRCDLPSTPQLSAGSANQCADLHQVTGSASEAQAEDVLSVSEDGSTVYFTASGVLADNDGALGEPALSGDRNLYVWRTDDDHPGGAVAFIGSLPEGDLPVGQSTPDGRCLVLESSARLAFNDTDTATDIYRYGAENGTTARVSTGLSGAGGNSESADARLSRFIGYARSKNADTPHHSHPAISDDGQLIVFVTDEPLDALDGNGSSDAYIWSAGHLRGSLGPAEAAAIADSGRDIYIESSAQLTSADGDEASDVYDVRVGGGFHQPPPPCSGEGCQPPPSSPPPSPDPGSARQPVDAVNFRPCPKGKVLKHGKCVKKRKKRTGKRKGKSHKHSRASEGARGGRK